MINLFYLFLAAIVLSGRGAGLVSDGGYVLLLLVPAAMVLVLAVVSRKRDDTSAAEQHAQQGSRLARAVWTAKRWGQLDVLTLARRAFAPKPILKWICQAVGGPFTFFGVLGAMYGIKIGSIEEFLGSAMLFSAFAFGPWIALWWARRSVYYVAPAALLLAGAAGWAASGAWGFFLIGLIAAAFALVSAVAARIQDGRPQPLEKTGGPTPSGPRPAPL